MDRFVDFLIKCVFCVFYFKAYCWGFFLVGSNFLKVNFIYIDLFLVRVYIKNVIKRVLYIECGEKG